MTFVIILKEINFQVYMSKSTNNLINEGLGLEEAKIEVAEQYAIDN